jgi:hypothetical protein
MRLDAYGSIRERFGTLIFTEGNEENKEMDGMDNMDLMDTGRNIFEIAGGRTADVLPPGLCSAAN